VLCLAITVAIMSDSKELSVLRAASQRLTDSDNDRTIKKFCHSAADVSAFEDALQQCSTEHFLTEAALSLSAAPDQETVQETIGTILWWLLLSVLTRKRRANRSNKFSWSLDGYSMVARIAKSILSSWCIDDNWIDDGNRYGYTLFMAAAEWGHASMVELLLADPRVDKASIDNANVEGVTALMLAARKCQTSIIELLLADPRVDKASMDCADDDGQTALMHAAIGGHWPIVNLLISDSRTTWSAITHLTHHRRIMQRDEMLPVIVAELTRRQMCVIYPSTNRLMWPVHIQSDAKSGDSKSSGPAADDEAKEEPDVIAESETQCALVTSFFKSDLFDVNVLRIIREYATYICSTTDTYTDSDSDSYY
jgi:Ankyrin repeats (3 copies)